MKRLSEDQQNKKMKGGEGGKRKGKKRRQRDRAVNKFWLLFSTHTGQLEDGKENFT